MTTLTVQLADKPRDLLVHLVEHGPATADELARVVGRKGLFAGGLVILDKLGLAASGAGERDQPWSATNEGRRMVLQARDRQPEPDQGSREVDLDALMGEQKTIGGWVSSARWWLDQIGDALPEASPMFKALVHVVRELDALKANQCPDAEVCKTCPCAGEDDACFPGERLRAENERLREAARETLGAIEDRWDGTEKSPLWGIGDALETASNLTRSR